MRCLVRLDELRFQRHVDRLRRARAGPCAVGWNGRRHHRGARVAFSQTPTGVHVVTNESFAGQPVSADLGRMQSVLDAPLASWLAHLKVAAESRARR